METVVAVAKGAAAAWKAFAAKHAISAAVIKFVATTAATYGVSRALTRRPGLGSLRGQEVNARDPAAPRQIIHGLRRVSGVLYPVGVSGTNNEFLHVLLLVAGHECEDLGDIYFNDELVPLDGSGNATGRYAGFVRIKKHLGSYNQTVDTSLQTDLGASYWSNNHRLQGIAYLYIRLKVNPDLFSGGMPEIYCVVKGRKLYDQRDGTQSATDPSTWKWSKNAALCLADWIRGVPTRNSVGTMVRNHGLGAADDEIDYTALNAAANICDEAVGVATSFTKLGDVAVGNRNIGVANTTSIVPGLKVTGTGIATGSTVTYVDPSGTYFSVSHDPTATNNGVTLTFGDTEPRYECNGVISSSVRAGDGIEVLKTAMAGDAPYIAGKWTILAGAYRTPTVTLDEGDLRAPLTGVRFKPSRRELYNVVRGLYVSPANNWQPADIPKVSNATYKTQDGGEDLPADVELQFTTSGSMAQRLNKIMMERSRQGIGFVARCKLTAFQNQAGDVIQFTNTRFGWTAKPFEVLAAALVVEDDANGNPYIGVDLTLKETASGVWDWNSGEETAIDLAPNTDLPDPFTVLPPTSLSVTNSVQQQADGTAVPRLQVSWTAPADIHVTSGGLIRLEYKLSASSDWLPVMTLRGDITLALILAVIIGQVYDVRIRAENNLGVASSWVTASSITVAGDTTGPAAPSGLAATVGTGKSVSLDWNDNTDDDLSEYKVFRSTTNDSSTAVEIAEVRASRFVDVDVSLGVTYYYWIKAVDTSENVSAFHPAATSGVQATPTTVGSTSVDSTAPNTPSAPTFASETTYLAGDGTVFARITIAAPALPSGAKLNQVLYRRTGASAWIIADELTGTGNATVDDLTPGQTYEFAIRAISFSNVPSAASSTLSRTAANTTGVPPDPTGANSNGGTFAAGTTNDNVPPVFTSGVRRYAMLFRWSESAASNPSSFGGYIYPSDFDRWELKATATDTDAATDYNLDEGNGIAGLIKTKTTKVVLCSNSAVQSYLRLRAVNRSGLTSNWVRITDITPGMWATPGGNAMERNVGTSSNTVAAGDDSRITGAAQKASNLSDLASASTARTNLGLGSVATESTVPVAKGGTGATDAATARTNLGLGTLATKNLSYVNGATVVLTLAGGVAEEAFNHDITAWGFSSKPAAVAINCQSDREYFARYDWDDAGNSATNIVLRVFRFNGANTSAGSLRFGLNPAQ